MFFDVGGIALGGQYDEIADIEPLARTLARLTESSSAVVSLCFIANGLVETEQGPFQAVHISVDGSHTDVSSGCILEQGTTTTTK